MLYMVGQVDEFAIKEALREYDGEEVASISAPMKLIFPPRSKRKR